LLARTHWLKGRVFRLEDHQYDHPYQKSPWKLMREKPPQHRSSDQL